MEREHSELKMKVRGINYPGPGNKNTTAEKNNRGDYSDLGRLLPGLAGVVN